MLVLVMCLTGLPFSAARPAHSAVSPAAGETVPYFARVVSTLSDVDTRRAGSSGERTGASFILSEFKSSGASPVGHQTFSMPVRTNSVCRMFHAETGQSLEMQPFISNAVSPGTAGKNGIEGHVIHAGDGELASFNHKPVKGAIVLMDFDSGKNWTNALSLGARALVYIQRPGSTRYLYQDKTELTPVDFPRFIITRKQAVEMFGPVEQMAEKAPVTVRIESDSKWERVETQNIYAFIPGTDDRLKDELVIVESFYDTDEFIAGNSPGADQACSIATLLDLARFLGTTPPARPVLLVATSGHAASLHGTREMIWAMNEEPQYFSSRRQHLASQIDWYRSGKNCLERYIDTNTATGSDLETIKIHLDEVIKAEIEEVNQSLMHLRLNEDASSRQIKRLADKRMALKQLGQLKTIDSLDTKEKAMVDRLVPQCMDRTDRLIEDTRRQLGHIDSAIQFKSHIRDKTIAAVVSLHLSSHGKGFGAFSRGGLYPLKSTIDRYTPYTYIDRTLKQVSDEIAGKKNIPGLLQDTLRPSLHRSWESFFKDVPPLGGEVSSMAGMRGFSLVTVHDARALWGTPGDTVDRVDMDRAMQQSRFVIELIHGLCTASTLGTDRTLPRNGFSTLKGRANFIRHGQLFAETPAPDSIILSFQGPGMYHAMVDEYGEFMIKGVADRKHVLHKLILEGYRFDTLTGKAVWAVDKKKTTKDRYRVKMNNRSTETDLIMFSCRQSTLTNLLEPRTFQYLTKINLFDARTDSLPLRHWYSRIDTRSSILCSLFLEPGTRIKLTLSDTMLTRKLILTNADKNHPLGTGYQVDTHPVIAPTSYLAARDMWMLLNPRIDNLEQKGIKNQKIRELRHEGNTALAQAQAFFDERMYDRFFSASQTALALAGRVYDHVEKTQKDVLYGVLFYILLFVPFAFCLERFLFAFTNIYRRIFSFLSILLVLILVIYNIHPAFELAYSPIVIILAFFIIGLSAMVTWILFSRFDEEMKRLQKAGSKGSEGEISLMKAFSASFFMGISNLRRRKVRTLLTCITLTILTFTLMSFTSVKNIRQQFKLLYDKTASYQGLLLKQANWATLPEQAFHTIQNTMAPEMTAVPRGWLETEERTRPMNIPVAFQDTRVNAAGLIGLSHLEPEISGMSRVLTRGRWFSSQDRHTVILSEQMAETLGVHDSEPGTATVFLWSIPFTVTGFFSGDAFDRFKDLDGEPLTPVTFPDEIFQQTTAAEMDAMEAGQDITAFQTRYTHIPSDQVLVIPYDTLVSLGGHLKSVALARHKNDTVNRHTFELVDRFGLWLFSGEKEGVYVYNASDSLNYSGIPNIIVPILISIFIVLNTMIGSVYERKKEIGVYTSIGMAPSHVSIIFIAEALSYAVLSVVAGYLVAQAVAKVFAGTVLLNGITVNYSSMAGVAAMAIVLLVVILSAVYPSRIAANIAIPDVNRTWEMTAARGNRLSIDLPFLLKTGEAKSARGFLYSFLSGHQEVSHGIFSIAELEMTGENKLHVEFTAWLAPFDLGIMQDVILQAIPSKTQEGFLELKMEIVRKSGEHLTWWRVNKRFVNLIRKQLLVWRSLSNDEKAYFAKTADNTGKDTAIA